ncbi:protein VAC14 homolog [Babylonia areolata]|uniref:protein VAC14 homolog n=1 Tax=Babylonia areolata TaxID=304850 RepID=UPI003FD539C6
MQLPSDLMVQDHHTPGSHREQISPVELNLGHLNKTCSMMNVYDSTPLLPATCARALVDKAYQKRKAAALELERIVKTHVSNGSLAEVIQILKYLGGDLAQSDNPVRRRGGVLGLAAVSIALGTYTKEFTRELILPALACCQDPDSSVQFQACETLFNIIKVLRSTALPFFNELFEALCKLMTHPNEEVRNGAAILDRLLKDIVSESSSFNLVSFVPILRERIYTVNTAGRQFVLSWIDTLNAVPDSKVLTFLPELLDGLFLILGDEKTEVCRLCQDLLADFLLNIKCQTSFQENLVSLTSMANVLVVHGQSRRLLAQSTALAWLKEFSALSPATMLPHLPGMLNAILPCLPYSDQLHKRVKSAAESLNHSLHNLMKAVDIDGRCSPTLNADQDSASKEDETTDTDVVIHMDVDSVVRVLVQHLGHKNVHTRVAVLKWIEYLLARVPIKTFKCVPAFFQQVMNAVTDESENVVLHVLRILVEIASSPTGNRMAPDLLEVGGKGTVPPPPSPAPSSVHDIAQSTEGLNQLFPPLMVALLSVFRQQPQLFEDRGSFVVRHLSVTLGSEAVFSSVAEIVLQEEGDPTFASTVVSTLNILLLTSTELFELRSRLKALRTKESRSLFCRLYRCWCHSPVAALSLCYLTHNYRHAVLLLQHFGDIEMTVDILKEIDRLVQLIESPVFSYLRLHLLDTERNGDLIHSLYGLLMILPQSEAFRALKCRLECVPHFSFSSSVSSFRNSRDEDGDTHAQASSDIPFQELLQHFVSVQRRHREDKMATLVCIHCPPSDSSCGVPCVLTTGLH